MLISSIAAMKNNEIKVEEKFTQLNTESAKWNQSNARFLSLLLIYSLIFMINSLEIVKFVNAYSSVNSFNSENQIQNWNFTKAVIKMPNINLYSSCGSVVVDGSESYSMDGGLLTFYWTLMDSNMKILKDNLPNLPIITIESAVPSGSYRVGLIVQSDALKVNSSLTISPIFTKATSPLPWLTMFKGDTVIEKYTNEFPLILRKIVTDSSCKSSKDALKIEWNQLSGPSINFTIDSFNNLFIPRLKFFGNYSYVFRVSAFYKTSAKVYLNVTLNTKSPELELNIVKVESTSELTRLQVEYLDKEAIYNENLGEIWNWTSSNQSPKLLSTLQTLSKAKTLQFSISADLLESKVDSIILTLEIKKSDGRTIQKSTTINFYNIPPLVNIVNIEPKTNIILRGQVITIQILTNSNNTFTTWSLNSKKIDSSSIIEHSYLGSEVNTMSIDTSNLEEGSLNSISTITKDIKTNLISQNEYSFTVAKSPKNCSCDVSPKEGIALSTDFLFYCTNCKTSENNLDYRYGFIDDKSHSKIVMYNLGDIYSTKLPLPTTGTSVTCFFDIIDKTTGAFTTSYSNITIHKPTIQNFADYQTTAEQWEDQSIQFTIDGDFSKSVYQSAITSRTYSILLKETMPNSGRNIAVTTCINGVEVSGECKCQDGWIGHHCEIMVEDFSNIQGTKLSILRDMFVVMNSTSGMSDDYLSLLSLAIESVLENYQYLDQNTISETLNSLNSFLSIAISNENIRLKDGVDELLSNSIENAYNYIKDRQHVSDQTSNSDDLLIAIKKSSFLQSRRIDMGNSGVFKKGSFFSSVLKRNTIYDFPTLITDSSSETKIKFDDSFMSIDEKSLVIVRKPFMSVLTISEDVFSLKRNFEINQKSANQVIYSKLVSPIVSFDFSELPIPVNASKISYFIPYNNTHSPEQPPLNILEYSEKKKTLSCGNFRSGEPTLLRSDCSIQERNETFVVCKCSNDFTNVFVLETTVVSYYSYVYIAAIVSSVVVCGLVLLIVAGIFFTIFIVKKHNDTVKLSESKSTSVFKVQEIEVESFYRKGQTSLGQYDSITPQEKSNNVAIQSAYHMNRKRSQVIPLRIDLLDEKYCDNLSSNGSDCEQ